MPPSLPNPNFIVAAPYTPEEAAAFWAHVQRKRGCWTWRGERTPDEEPYYLFRDTCVPRRAAWELLHGPLPGTLRPIPRCANRDCVRPDHLGLVSGRVRILPYGTGYPPARRWPGLTPTDEQAIRRAFATGHLTYRALAVEFDCARSTILRVLRRRFWRRGAAAPSATAADAGAGVNQQIGG
jgi:hypothetical protein